MDPRTFADAGNAVFPREGSAIETFFPSSEAELSDLLRRADEGNIQVTVTGALTGLTGAAVPRGPGWRLDFSRFVELPDRAGYRRVAPFLLLSESDPGLGLVAPGASLAALNEALAPRGLWYPPHPGETRAQIGGNVATNASGPRTFAFGATREYVRSLRVVLAGGDVLALRRDGRNDDGVTEGAFEARTESGRVLRGRVPGYAMPEVKNATGLHARRDMDLIDLFIGSEGLLGAFSEIGLRFLPQRPLRGTIFLFPSDAAALDFTDRVRPFKADASRYPEPRADGLHGVTALEYLDANSLSFAREAGHAVPEAARAAIEAETFAGDSILENILVDEAAELGCLGMVPPDASASFRYSVPRGVADLLKRRGRPKFGTDFAVPVGAFRELFAFYQEKAREFAAGRPGVHSALWGHVGDCHLHLNLLCESEDDPARAAAIYLELARKALSLGGALSAEHGVGKKTLADEDGVARPYLWYQFGEKYLEIGETKKAFDPKGILNAGNMGA